MTTEQIAVTDVPLASGTRMVAAEERRSVPDGIAESRPSEQSVLTCNVNGCLRQFSSKRGLSQHQRKAHPEEYHSKGESRKEGSRCSRWTSAETYLLAKQEAILVKQGVTPRQMNAALFREQQISATGPPADRIRNRRKTTVYKEKLKQCLKELEEDCSSQSESSQSQSTSPVAGLRTDYGNGTEPETDQVHPVSLGSPTTTAIPQWRENLLEALRDSQIAQKVDINSLGNGSPNANERKTIDEVYLEWNPPRKVTKGRKTATSPQKLPSGAKRKLKAREERRRQYARIQRLFGDDRGKCARIVLDGTWKNEEEGKPDISLADQEKFWGNLFEKESTKDSRSVRPELGERYELIAPVTSDEVKLGKRKMKKGAPGPDMQRKADISRLKDQEVADHFNLWMLAQYQPSALHDARTILIPKIPKPREPAKFRPITIAPMLIRLFHAILGRRISKNLKYDSAQKGFVSNVDGVAEATFVVKNLIRRAKAEVKPLHMAFIDVRKAFDSVSHETMLKAAAKLGMPEPLIRYLQCFYANANTRLAWNGGTSRPLKLGRGVRQGDPLSGYLFNAILDWVICDLRDEFGVKLKTGLVAKAVAFADDLCVMAETKIGLQAQVDILVEKFKLAGMEVSHGKDGKSQTLSIDADGKRKKWVCNPNPFVRVNGDLLPAVSITQKQKYLGLGISASGCFANVKKTLEEGLDNIQRAPLKPQQRLYILKQHLLPQLDHQLSLASTTAKYRKHLDFSLRRSVRNWLKLPKDTPISYIHARIEDGGLGIPKLVERAVLLYNNRILKMRNRSDPDPVVKFFLESLPQPAQPRLGGRPLGSVSDLDKANADCLYQSVDGRGLEKANVCKDQHKWLSQIEVSTSLKGHTFINAVKLRGNLVNTPARASRGRREQGGCPRCGDRFAANLNHIFQMCSVTHGLRIDRHDRLKGLIAGKAKAKGWNVLIEPQFSTKRGLRRPDLIISGKVPGSSRKVIVVADVTITHDKENGFELAKRKKKESYGRSNNPAYDNPCVEAFARNWANVETEAEFFVVGLVWNWRGLIETETASFLTEVLKLGKSTLSLASIRCLEKSWKVWIHWRDSTYAARRSL